MEPTQGYAVFFFDAALEALGPAIVPFLKDGPAGRHVRCAEIDTGGSLVEMTLAPGTVEGQSTQTELLVPASMIRMIVSVRSDEAFGFGVRDARIALAPASQAAPVEPAS